jgi:hypothetical protein
MLAYRERPRPQLRAHGRALQVTNDAATFEDPRAASVRRIPGVDALKGVLIAFVLLSHTHVFVVGTTSEAGLLARALAEAATFVDLWILPLAVPTFLVASLWIYATRRDGTMAYLLRRLRRLGLLYIVWTGVQYAIAAMLDGAGTHFAFRDLLIGGPTISAVGGSVVYFLSSLILLTCMLEGLYRLTPRLRSALSLAIVTVVLAGFVWLAWVGYYMPFWYPLAFVPAAPLVALFHERGTLLRRVWPIAATLWFAASLAEMVFSASAATVISPYARVSLWAGAMGLMGLIGLGAGSPNAWLARLGTNTMGVFVLNSYVAAAFYALLPRWDVQFVGLVYDLSALPIFALTAVVSIGLTIALKRTPLKAVL